MEGIAGRNAVRARADLAGWDRVADGLLGGGGPRVPLRWGEVGGHREPGPRLRVPQARRDTEPGTAAARDAAAERENIRSQLHRAHQRRARRRRVLTRLG